MYLPIFNTLCAFPKSNLCAFPDFMGSISILFHHFKKDNNYIPNFLGFIHVVLPILYVATSSNRYVQKQNSSADTKTPRLSPLERGSMELKLKLIQKLASEDLFYALSIVYSSMNSSVPLFIVP
uniref:Uncharacterized protein n=1 Tax=Cacopsylla melanoneura TaxID=428564 RepID=A0A8D8V4Z3_9HEMI